MKSSFAIVSDFINRNLYPVLLILFVLWMCIGIFPLQCYETDGQEIILGCDIMYSEGWTLPPVYSYAYWMQPLVTILVVSLKHLIPFLTCEQIYCLLTAVASLIFLLGCVSFARHITGASKTKILIAAILLPEMYAIAMYPNTAVFAAACFVWSLILISRNRYLEAGFLMLVAVLFRLDIVTVYPVIFPLFWYEGKKVKKSFVLSLAYGVVIIIASLILYWLLGANMMHTLDEYHLKNNLGFSEFALAIVGYYSMAYLLLLPIGLCLIIIQKQGKLLSLVLLPILLVHGFTMGSASKHFLYLSPFVIIIGIFAILWLEEKGRCYPIFKWTSIGIVVVFLTISVRKQNLKMSWLQKNPLHQVGSLVSFYSIHKANTCYTFGIGAGYQLITADEDMLLTGHLFYSWYIHSLKQILKEWRTKQKSLLDSVPTSNILTFEWGALSPISIDFMNDLYHFHQKKGMPDEYMYTISNQNQDLHFWRIVMPGGEITEEEILTSIDNMPTSFLNNKHYVVAGSNHYGTSYILDRITQTGRLEKIVENLYCINYDTTQTAQHRLFDETRR